MSNLKERIKNLQSERLEEIKTDPTLTKIKKLEAFYDEDLMAIRGYISHPFKKYEDLLRTQEEARGSRCIIIDDYINMNYECGRGTEISYASICDQLIEMAEYEECTTVVIVKCRGDMDYSTNPPTKIIPASISIPIQEAIDHLYDYALENNECGFVYDW